MQVRKTEERDLAAIGEIYSAAKLFMRKTGNATQWASGRPNEESAREDMERGVGYVLVDGDEVVAVFMFGEGPDETYLKIYDGAWQNNLPYSVIHRIAVRYPGRGLIGECINYCLEYSDNIKIDTHADNVPMQKALTKRGFIKCGTILLKNGEPRLAFQRYAKKQTPHAT